LERGKEAALRKKKTPYLKGDKKGIKKEGLFPAFFISAAADKGGIREKKKRKEGMGPPIHLKIRRRLGGGGGRGK